jgi:hypothetical protein
MHLHPHTLYIWGFLKNFPKAFKIKAFQPNIKKFDNQLNCLPADGVSIRPTPVVSGNYRRFTTKLIKTL